MVNDTHKKGSKTGKKVSFINGRMGDREKYKTEKKKLLITLVQKMGQLSKTVMRKKYFEKTKIRTDEKIFQRR